MHWNNFANVKTGSLEVARTRTHDRALSLSLFLSFHSGADISVVCHVICYFLVSGCDFNLLTRRLFFDMFCRCKSKSTQPIVAIKKKNHLVVQKKYKLMFVHICCLWHGMARIAFGYWTVQWIVEFVSAFAPSNQWQNVVHWASYCCFYFVFLKIKKTRAMKCNCCTIDSAPHRKDANAREKKTTYFRLLFIVCNCCTTENQRRVICNGHSVCVWRDWIIGMNVNLVL